MKTATVFFALGLGRCVSACDRPPLSKSLFGKEGDCGGNNIYTTAHIVSYSECWAACQALPTCKYFVFYDKPATAGNTPGWTCFPKTACAAITDAPAAAVGRTAYVRENCGAKPAPAPMKTCKSVGDPHIYPFDPTPYPGGRFDNHAVGWKTLYVKGDLMIQAHQKTWLTTKNVAVNAAIRYTTKATGDLNAASTWKTPNGQTVENPSTAPFATSAANFADPAPSTSAKLKRANVIEFPDNFLTLQIIIHDWRFLSTVIPGLGFFYDVWVTTNDYAGAKGQCVDGKAGQDAGMGGGGGRSLEDSDGVAFPTGADAKVTPEKAAEACAKISHDGLKKDCETDVRMVNEPTFIDKVVDGFKKVETVDKAIEAEFHPTTTTVTATPTATITKNSTAVSSAIRTSVTFLIATVLAVGFCV